MWPKDLANEFWIWTEGVHNLKGSLDNIKGNTQQIRVTTIGVSCHLGQKEYFLTGFLTRWSGSKLHRSIYLS